MITAEEIMSTMRDIVADQGPRPIPSALHVGSKRVLELLGVAAGWKSTHERRDISQLYGVPVIIGSMQAPPLGELGWRLLDQHGEIISQGVLSDA